MSTNILNGSYISVASGGGGSGGPPVGSAGAGVSVLGTGLGVTQSYVNSTINVSQQGNIYNSNGLTLSDGTHTLTLADLVSRLEKIEERLAILNTDAALLEKYPGLREVYDEYKIIERITGNGN